MKKWKLALRSILLPVLTGLLAGLIISGSTDVYEVFIKPPFSLPGNLFGVAWTTLYVLMGVALFLFRQAEPAEKDLNEGNLLFYVQLFLNFLWPIIFFRLQLPLAAFFELILLFIFVALTAIKFYQTNKLSGILLLPYLLYVLYAGYLNFAIWYLNM